MYDTLAIVKTPTLQMANQHPWFYIVMTQAVVRIVEFFGGSFEASFSTLAVIQVLLIATTYSYCIEWLQVRGLSFKILIPIAVFLIFCPFLDLFMINIFKDILYNLLLVAWMPLLYELWENNGTSLKKPTTLIVMACFVILSLLRNNGFYVSFLILVAILGCFPQMLLKRILILSGILVITIIGSVSFEKYFNITHLFQETIGIPFQQMAGVIYYDGKISDKDKKFINEISPVDYIKENFYPYNIDRIKWGEIHINEDFFSQHEGEFFKIWARLLIPNFNI
ncbi:MAG: DUF6020 family protein, partial [Burkholderiales bacterium]|nr:DUF6020 family protein [Burkholderiales bacterium]